MPRASTWPTSAACNRSWDVHAERQLQCTDCHHALNNPAHGGNAKGKPPRAPALRPAHARHRSDYLQRPDHDFARGQSAQVHVAPELKGTMRRCENCHDASVSHARWLPYVETHMATLACESCHIPQLYAPAIQSYDWTVLAADGQPVRGCRGVDGTPGDVRSLVTGFEPVLLQRTNIDRATLLAPYNLITSFYWIYEDAQGRRRPVRLADLQAAFLDGGRHAGDIVAAFDIDHDGVVGAAELRIDTPQKEAAVKARLDEARPAPGAHGRPGAALQHQPQRHARRACAEPTATPAISTGSRLTQPMQLAAFAPVLPAFDANNNVSGSGRVIAPRRRRAVLPAGAGEGCGLRLRRHAASAGSTRSARWPSSARCSACSGTACCASSPGASGRTRPAPTKRVHMYDAYRRFWHWLQAISIVALLATGLSSTGPTCSRPSRSARVVTLHNVLAAILVINAALSLFYHLATERMREYMPRPYGFFDDAIRQAKYYLSGIFKGEAHPFEKRPDDRMNPIQKLTYFGILNVLLPLQIVTGALMWGVQHWPQIAARARRPAAARTVPHPAGLAVRQLHRRPRLHDHHRRHAAGGACAAW